MDAPRMWLIAAAAPREVRAVVEALGGGPTPGQPWDMVQCGDTCEVLWTGVGKASAAGAVGRWFDPDRHAGVLSVGVAGALPGSWLEIGSVVLGEPSRFTDEGVQTPRGFQGLDAIGFGGDAPAIYPDAMTRGGLEGCVDVIGGIATVSVCSGTDELAQRTGGDRANLAEAMEGAAVGLAARRIDPDARFGELRVISNTTGDRSRQRWDLDLALGRIGELMPTVVRVLGGDR